MVAYTNMFVAVHATSNEDVEDHSQIDRQVQQYSTVVAVESQVQYSTVLYRGR